MRPFLLFLLFTAVPPAPGEWLRFESPHFHLYTDAGEKTGREAMFRLEQVRHAFRDFAGVERASPLPVQVFLFRHSSDFRRYRPSANTRGFFRGGPEANYIVMHTGSGETWRVAFHEYVHLVLNQSSARLPQWLEEGTAEFYSTLQPIGDKLVIGGVIRNHVLLLKQRAWLNAKTLAEINHDSPAYNERERASVFYAQSWALVHMLNMAPYYRQRLPRFAELIAEAVPAAEAFQQAFGATLASAIRKLRTYVAEPRWPTMEIEWEQPEEVSVEVKPLSDSEAQMAQLDLQFSLGLWEMSEEELHKLANKKGETPEIVSARGMVAMSRRDFEQAKRHFERSIELGSTQASTHFEYAMLLRETGGDRDRVSEYLNKAIALNPSYAEAHYLLGTMAATDGRHEDAIESFLLATGLLPRRANFWHALALSYNSTGQRKEAQHAARRALDAARTPQEREMAEAAIRLTSAAEPVQLTGRPAVNTPKSWFNKQGDSRVEGELTRIDCLGEAARFHVRSSAESVVLFVADSSKVVLKNLSSLTFEFSCGGLEPRPVVVEYTARPDEEHKTTGDVTSIEFQAVEEK